MDLEPRYPPPQSSASTALSSPIMATHDGLDEISDDMMMMEPGASALGLSESFKKQAMKNSKGNVFWDTFSETSSTGIPQRVTPPPPAFGLTRAASSGFAPDDMSMGSPSASSNGGGASQTNPFLLGGTHTAASSSGHGTPLNPLPGSGPNNNNTANNTAPATATTATMPTAAEITRRINSKRRRDDDLDPVSIKRRAVSPGMSVHNSPVMQSPLQRDMAPWGGNHNNSNSGGGGGGGVVGASRPGSVGGDSSSAAGGKNGGSGAGSENGSVGGRGGPGGKARVGFQGMVDTNDGITRLSIE